MLVNGPRAAGKTTTARPIAVAEVRLDHPAQAAAFRADPDSALRDRPEPLLLDEWQEVPDILGAVKRAVDDDPWPGTGRLQRVRMYSAGSLAKRHNGCGEPNSRCNDEPPQMHGPYWQWTAKVNGKTVNRRFNTTPALLSQEWSPTTDN